MFVSVRRYEGIDPADFSAINAIIHDGFLPVLRESPGFVLYALGNCEPDVVLVLNVFHSEAEMLSSNERAAHFVGESLAQFLPNPPQITAGTAYALALPRQDGGLEVNDEAQPLFFSFRRYTGFNALDTIMITRLVVEDLIPVFVESPGFRLYVTLNAMDRVLGALTIFTTREAMHASTESAADFVAAELAPLLPQAPVVTEGRLGVFWQAPRISQDPV